MTVHRGFHLFAHAGEPEEQGAGGCAPGTDRVRRRWAVLLCCPAAIVAKALFVLSVWDTLVASLSDTPFRPAAALQPVAGVVQLAAPRAEPATRECN